MSTVKLLARGTPDLAESENTKTEKLLDTAGRLSGMFVSALAAVGTNQFSITLEPGAWVHDGVVVVETTPVFLVFTKPTVALTKAVYLVGQSGGFDSQAGVTYSLIGQDAFNSIQDAKNFAAIIAVYNYKLTGDVEQQVLFTSPAPAAGQDQWEVSPALSNKWDIVNGTIAGKIFEATGNDVQAIKLGALSSPQVGTIDKLALTLTTYAEDTAATVATGSATLTGPIAAGFVSIFINAIETTVPTVVADALTTLNNLRTAVMANAAIAPLIDFPASLVAGGAGAATWSITSLVKGEAANFDIQVSFSPGTAAVSFTRVAMSGGLQPHYTIEFAETPTGPAIYDTITVFPPVTPVALPVYSVIEIPFATGTTLAPTFANLYLRLKQIASTAGAVAISNIQLLATFSETNNAIDLNPPLDPAHWTPGLSVSGASGSALGPHRLLQPIDHPDRSITAIKYRIGSVDKFAVDPRILGNNYAYHNHLDSEWTLPPASAATAPWNVINDLSLKDCSELVKHLSRFLFEVTGVNLADQFNKDHESKKLDNTPLTGHHRSALFSSAETGGSSAFGMRVLPLRDLSSPEPETPGDPNMDPPGISTKSQMFIRGSSIAVDPTDSRVKDAAMNRRKNQETSPNLWVSSLETVGINSKDVAGPGTPPAAVSSEIIMEWSVEASKPYARVARTLAGLKEWFGFRKINGFPVAGLQSNRMTLFSGALAYVRTDQVGTWDARVGGTPNKIFSDVLFSGTPNPVAVDGSGAVNNSPFNSHIPDPVGTPVYARPSRDGDQGVTSAGGLAPATSWLGNWPSPNLNNAFLTRDAALGMQWLYLPFFIKDIFDAVVVRAIIYQGTISSTTSSDPGSNYGVLYGGMLAAPAYDVREMVAPQISAPTHPVTAIQAFRPRAVGVVRRHPWVLSPMDLNFARGTFGATDAAVYYDPRNGGATPADYDPLKFFTTYAPIDRPSNLISGNFPTGSWVDRGPLPYYDKRRSTDTSASPPAGVLIDRSQLVQNYQAFPVTTLGATPFAFGISYNVEVTIPLKDYANSFVHPSFQTNPSDQVRTPDGIVFCPHRFDWGMIGKNAGVFNDDFIAGYLAGTHLAEAPGLVHLDVVGIVDGRYTPLLKL